MIRSIAFFTLPDNYRGSEHMAEKRMFAKTIIDSDAFLDMPASAQALYFHLSMRADDEGFVNNPRKIQRMIGTSEDDLKLLYEKRFVIPFESGIVAIKHWRINNCIRQDRMIRTKYQDERKLLIIKENGSYSINEEQKSISDGQMSGTCQADDGQMTGKCQADDGQMSGKCPANVRIDKNRLDKSSIDNIDVSKIHLSDLQNHVPYDSILNLYHSECKSFPKVRVLSNKRKKAISARWKFYKQDLETFKKVFQLAEESSFLKGQNRKNWSADFDWMMCDANMAKILDGKYKDRKEEKGMIQNKPSDFDFAEIERMSMSDVEE